MPRRNAVALGAFAIAIAHAVGGAALMYFYGPNPFGTSHQQQVAPLALGMHEQLANEQRALERATIAALLEDLAASKAVFIRNGTEYSGADAADHLRRKLRAAGEKVRTAEEFIELLATRSSASGEAYRVRDGGEEFASADWFRKRLAALQTAPVSARAEKPGAEKRGTINAHAEDGAREVLAFLRAQTDRFRIVESDEIEFYSGRGLARRIDFKYTLAGRPKVSVDAFIEQFCTSSSLHGTEYQIDSEPPRALGEWLKAGLVR